MMAEGKRLINILFGEGCSTGFARRFWRGGNQQAAERIPDAGAGGASPAGAGGSGDDYPQ